MNDEVPGVMRTKAGSATSGLSRSHASVVSRLPSYGGLASTGGAIAGRRSETGKVG